MKILVASKIDPAALEQLQSDHEVVCAFNAKTDVLKRSIAGCHAVVLRSGVDISAEVMRCAPDLKLLVRAGSGFDNIDVDYAQSHNIHLERIPGPGAKAVAELSFAMMLSLARNVREADRQWREGHWVKNQLTGYLLTGKVLGIVGVGNIGSRVGRLGVAWDMEAIGCLEHPTPEKEQQLTRQGIRLADFEEVLTQADFLSVHVPLKDSTRNLLDADSLARMKPGAFVVNLARGGVVDEAALRHELITPGRLCGAALDVHAQEGEGHISPLADLPNVLLTPHIGAGTVDSQREIGQQIIEVIEAFASRSNGQAAEKLVARS